MNTKSLCIFLCLIYCTLSFAAVYPPTPPPVPAKFENLKELREYLYQLHLYNVITGRPRYGKRKTTHIIDDLASDVSTKESDKIVPFDQMKLLNDTNEVLSQWINRFKLEQFFEEMKKIVMGLKRPVKA